MEATEKLSHSDITEKLSQLSERGLGRVADLIGKLYAEDEAERKRDEAADIMLKARLAFEAASAEAARLEAEAEKLDPPLDVEMADTIPPEAPKKPRRKPATKTAQAGDKPTESDILMALKTLSEPSGVGAIAECLGCDKSLVSPVLAPMVSAKTVKKTGERRGTKYQLRAAK